MFPADIIFFGQYDHIRSVCALYHCTGIWFYSLKAKTVAYSHAEVGQIQYSQSGGQALVQCFYRTGPLIQCRMCIRPAHSAAASRIKCIAIVEPCATYCGDLRPTDSSKLHYLPPRQNLWLFTMVRLWTDRADNRLSPGQSPVPACECSLWAELAAVGLREDFSRPRIFLKNNDIRIHFTKNLITVSTLFRQRGRNKFICMWNTFYFFFFFAAVE